MERRPDESPATLPWACGICLWLRKLSDFYWRRRLYPAAWLQKEFKSFFAAANPGIEPAFFASGFSSRSNILSPTMKANPKYKTSKIVSAIPEIKIKGIGGLLLNEFERIEKGKKIYLYTDNACTYQFYKHRGFERVGEKNIVLKIGNKKIDLQCLLYSKVI